MILSRFREHKYILTWFAVSKDGNTKGMHESFLTVRGPIKEEDFNSAAGDVMANMYKETGLHSDAYLVNVLELK